MNDSEETFVFVEECFDLCAQCDEFAWLMEVDWCGEEVGLCEQCWRELYQGTDDEGR